MNRADIAIIYKELTGKTARQTSCRQCWDDYLTEIYIIMAKKKKKGEDVAAIEAKISQAEKSVKKAEAKGYELYPCYSIKVKGTIYTSKNLTDEAAEQWLSSGGAKNVFKTIPKKVEAAPEVTEPVQEEIENTENLD